MRRTYIFGINYNLETDVNIHSFLDLDGRYVKRNIMYIKKEEKN